MTALAGSDCVSSGWTEAYGGLGNGDTCGGVETIDSGLEPQVHHGNMIKITMNIDFGRSYPGVPTVVCSCVSAHMDSTSDLGAACRCFRDGIRLVESAAFGGAYPH